MAYADRAPFIPEPDMLVYPSRTGGDAHTVTIHLARRAGGAFDVGQRYVTCTCKAGQYRAFIGRRAFPGCWAMQAARRVVNIPAIAATGYDARYR